MKFIGAAALAGIERALSVNVGLRGEIHAAAFIRCRSGSCIQQKREWSSFRWELIYPTVTAGAET
jgi:hypothetical protein